MEKHFLEGMMVGSPEFRAEPWYNADGDCLIFQMADEAFVAERVDELLTVYKSAIDCRMIGFQIKGVQAIVNKFGLEGLTICAQADADEVKSVSIAAMLLAAYEEGPKTVRRRTAYASVMNVPGDGQIASSELQPV